MSAIWWLAAVAVDTTDHKTEAAETAIRWRIDWRRDGLLFWEARDHFQHVREMGDKGSFPFLFLFKVIIDSNGVHYSLFMRTLLLSVSLTPYCWPNSLKPLLQVDTFTSECSKQSQTKILPVHLVQGMEVSIVVPFHTEDSHLWKKIYQALSKHHVFQVWFAFEYWLLSNVVFLLLGENLPGLMRGALPGRVSQIPR